MSGCDGFDAGDLVDGCVTKPGKLLEGQKDFLIGEQQP